MKVKICGITNLEDALASINAGCDALGFVFYKKSPRYITPEKARVIIENLPKRALKIGVFVNEGEKSIKNIDKFCRLDILQFHGDESPEFCSKFKGCKIIKAFKVKDKIDVTKIKKFKTFAWLFDTFVKAKPGGTGKKFNWGLLKQLPKAKPQIFLSGGLTAGNVRQAIELLHPDWVDVSSSVELCPGKKDREKTGDFIRVARLCQ